MKIIGIDPGFSGAIAVLNYDGTVLRVHDMPLTQDENNISIGGIRELMFDILFDKNIYYPVPDTGFLTNAICYLENVNAMQFKDKITGEVRSQSTASFGTYKEHVGYLTGFCHAIGLRCRHIHSKQWQTMFGVKGKQMGNDSISTASRLFPNIQLIETGARGGEIRKNGRSDALLIAEFGRRQTREDTARKVA